MDIVDFFKTANRLCKNRTSGKCPIWKNGTCMNDFGDDSAKSIVTILIAGAYSIGVSVGRAAVTEDNQEPVIYMEHTHGGE